MIAAFWSDRRFSSAYTLGWRYRRQGVERAAALSNFTNAATKQAAGSGWDDANRAIEWKRIAPLAARSDQE